ncbi:type II secretion system F family protein [Sphingomonas sp. BN140010]|uniref:Type II secretion system F family protein n=1 Tax=Sphingomonas arvum TaxID=2992113 RepID=A0ABT3JDN7_9SPHN|nr:type II secretion system F family protein [Sphingomonas sp. BN140010]MCW3797182.1 type II secretion system F family protein [Sphingomonas sp. BN140010]
MNPAWLKALVLVCIFATVLLIVETVVSAIARDRAEGKAVNLRLRLIGRGHSNAETMQLLRRQGSVVSERLPPLVRGLALRLERLLVAAQLTMPLGRLMLGVVLAPAVLFLLLLVVAAATGTALGFGRLLMLATLALLIGGMIPIMYLQVRATRTRKKMQDQFPVALDVFIRGLRAGHPIAAALDLLTVEMPDPIGSEFGLVVDEVTYGADLRDALQAMAERWDSDDMRMFVTSLSVQAETGGNLAEVLENLSTVIRERHSMMLKVRALSSEGRMTAVMLTALPVLAFTGLFLMNPGFYLDVADDPAFVPGFTGLLLFYVVGFIWIRKLVNLKV